MPTCIPHSPRTPHPFSYCASQTTTPPPFCFFNKPSSPASNTVVLTCAPQSLGTPHSVCQPDIHLCGLSRCLCPKPHTHTHRAVFTVQALLFHITLVSFSAEYILCLFSLSSQVITETDIVTNIIKLFGLFFLQNRKFNVRRT